MRKINYIKLITVLCSVLFFSKSLQAQVDQSSTNNQKTVIYKIRLDSKTQTVSQATCDNIDKMFTEKTGIISAKTNPSTFKTTVKMISAVPEQDLKAIFASQKLEVESINVIDNKN